MKIDLIKYSDYIPERDFDNNIGLEVLSDYRVDNYLKEEEITQVKSLSSEIRMKADVLLVIGIGGSYMGAKAVVSALEPYYEKSKPEIIFLGNNLDPKYYDETLAYLQDKEIYLNVISKSGETLEPSLAFEIAMSLMKKKYSSEELEKRVIVSTSQEQVKLKEIAIENNYRQLFIPNEIGGRFSVFTVVGLLAIAVAGYDIDKFLEGARKAYDVLDLAKAYAQRRKELEEAGKVIEAYTIYEERLLYLVEWLKQLFGETQGKNNKGLYPSYNLNTRDLHSMGQYLQEGKKIVFETVIYSSEEYLPKAEILKGKFLKLNRTALEAVAKAHSLDQRPSLLIELEEINEFNLGYLMQFMILASIIGALIDEVNPFDQPGVEAYKREIKKSLENDFDF